MKAVFSFIGNFIDEDISWFNQHGQRHLCKDNETLIKQGIPPKYLCFVLEGAVVVVHDKKGELARLSEGDVFGEISFVDERLPLAATIAEENTLVLRVRRDHLQDKINVDAPFAARFYRAISMFLADRLRKMTKGPLTRTTLFNDELSQESEVNPELLQHLMLNGQRFITQLKRVPRNRKKIKNTND